MTQYVAMVRPAGEELARLTRSSQLSLADGRGPGSESFGEEAAQVLGCASRGQVLWLQDPAGDEVDPLVDDLYNALMNAEDPDSTDLMKFLRDAAALRVRMVASWGGDLTDLDVVQTWSALRALVLEAAARQPPELYFHFIPAEAVRLWTPTLKSPLVS